MIITTKGIGAHAQHLELGRLTVLVGPNGSGKSKIAEAIRMVALGYIPQLGKRPQDMAALMNGERMSVELILENGQTIRRELQRVDKGFTANAEASWMRAGKPGEVSKAITKLFGQEEQDVAECLDIRELLSATPNQRAARMEQLLASGARTAEEISKDVARLIVMRLAETTEDRMPADYKDALPMIPDGQKAILFEQAEMIKAKIAEAGIAGALTWANLEKRGASDGLKKKEAAADELRKRAAQVPEPDPRDITRLGDGISVLQQDLGAARQASITFNEKTTKSKHLKAELEELTRLVANSDKAAGDIEAIHGKQLRELEKKTAAIQAELDELKPPAQAPTTEIDAQEKKSRELSKKADDIDLPSVPDATTEERAVADFQARIELAEMSEWSEVLLAVQEIEDAAAAKGLKTAMVKPIKRLRELAKKGLGADPQELKHALDVAKQKFEAATKAVEKATAAREKAVESQQALCKEADAALTKSRDLRKTWLATQAKALADFEVKRSDLRRELASLQNKMSVHKDTLEGHKSERATLDRRVASVNDQLKGLGPIPKDPARPEPIQEQLEKTKQELQQLIDARATHTEIHLVLDAIEAAKAAAIVFTGIEWALQRQREIEISNAGGPLMRTMAQFLKDADRKETPFIRATQGNCAIGWRTADNKEIQIQALSGGEWVLFAAALTTAVILCRLSQVKILLVEAGETDAHTIDQLLQGIAGAGDEQLTAIVMTPREKLGPAAKGWDIVKVKDQSSVANAATN
jgi:DNA repair exonuclease SbcCD ATPase subunit